MKNLKLKFAATAVFFSICSFTTYSVDVKEYYSTLDGKSGTNLWNAVKAVAKKDFSKISYGTSTWEAFQETDVRMVNGQECWWDMYSNNNVPANPKPSSMNIEHSVANSWWGGTKNDAYCDIVHLNPSNADANSRKGNYPLGIIGTRTWDNGVTFIGKPASGYGGGSTYVYEPCDEYKGDFARVFMYMFIVYDDISWKSNTEWMYDTSSSVMFKPWAYEMLLKWSAADPVSTKEINRNNGISRTQGNRNPFIDMPELADYIWGDKKGERFNLDGSSTPVDPDDPDDPDTPDDPDDPVIPDNPVNPDENQGKFVLVSNDSEIQSGAKYLILGEGSDVAMSINNSGAYFSITDVQVSNGVITSIPADAAIIDLKESGSKYILHVTDKTGAEHGYIVASGKKTVQYSSTDGTPATIHVSDGIATVDYGASGMLRYNNSAPRFTTYTSNLKDLRFFKYEPLSTEVVKTINDEDDSFLVEVWGHNILVPEGAIIFDINGHQVNGENVQPGIYFVVKPTFHRTVKVMVK